MKNSGPARSASPAQRALMRAGLLATVVGTVLGGSGTTATAADVTDDAVGAAEGLSQGLTAPLESLSGVEYAVAGVTGTLKNYQLDPLAGTGADPLDNGVGTQIADFRRIGTETVTGPIARGGTLADLPVVGPLASKLPG